MFGMSSEIAKQSPEASSAQDIKEPRLGWMIAFVFVVSFLGLFSVVPLRKVHFNLITSSNEQYIHEKMSK